MNEENNDLEMADVNVDTDATTNDATAPDITSGNLDDLDSVAADSASLADLPEEEVTEASSQTALIAQLQAKVAEAEKQALLHQADLENFRRRKSKEAQDGIRYASLPLITGILEVSDNLQRALDSATEDENATKLREGVEIVKSQLLATLETHGCTKISAVGETFDPNRHEAIQMQASDEPNNTIIMEVQSGFTLHDRVVRPAKVIISTGPAS